MRKKAFFLIGSFILITLLLLIFVNSPSSKNKDMLEKQRHSMVEQQIVSRGIKDERVIAAMRIVPRHKFVATLFKHKAYIDQPVSIGHQQTISQPYIVALMTELAAVDENSVVFEVGTGSGYQAAVLGRIVKDVYTVEYIEPLGLEAKNRIAELGYTNIHVKIGDGYQGWPEHAPFDAILVTAGIDHVPKPLIDQLKRGGRIVIPVGKNNDTQELLLITKNENDEVFVEKSYPVRFVPFLGPKK